MVRKLIRKTTQALFAFWARLHKSPADSWQSYPQTWGLQGWRRPSKALCNLLIGHEISLTETSYSGGDWAIKHCRWCNESIPIPARESEFVDRWGNAIQSQTTTEDPMETEGFIHREGEVAMTHLGLYKMAVEKNVRYETFLRVIAETDGTPRTRKLAIAALCGDEYDESKFFPHE